MLGGVRQWDGSPAVRAVDTAAALRGGAGGRRRLHRHAAARRRARLPQRPPRHAHAAAAGRITFLISVFSQLAAALRDVGRGQLHSHAYASAYGQTVATSPTFISLIESRHGRTTAL